MSRPATGSVYLRNDGYWVASVTLNGKRVAKYARSKNEARQRLKDLLQAHGAQTLVPPARVTFAQWADQWLDMRGPDLRPTTARTYRNALRPFYPLIGMTRLDRLTPAQIAGALAAMRAQGLGSRRVQQSYAVFSNTMNAAFRLNMIAVNPAQRVDRPKHEEQRRACWTADQLVSFVAAALESTSRYAPLFVLLAATGLRISEALALRWTDVDWQHNQVRVERALVFVGNRSTMQQPKSRDGRRTLALPAVALDALRAVPRSLEDGPIFQTRNGTAPRPAHLHDRLQALCVQASVPAISVHGLRHVNAALLAASGVDAHTLRQHMGHSTIQMSLQRYAYAMRSDRVAANTFDRAMGGGGL